MNNLLVRAWDKENKEMFIPYGLLTGANGILAINKDGSQYHISNFELMQWIGLKDKNGTNIFEGDIIWETLAYPSMPNIVVEYKIEYCINPNNNAGVGYNIGTTDSNKVEVIGNIYENKELL